MTVWMRAGVYSVVARAVRGPHRVALARVGKRAKIVYKNSRENSYCKFRKCLRLIKTKRYSQPSAYLSPIVGTVGYDIGSY